MTTNKLPESLIEHFGKGLCIPWCGAGVSADLGLPTWSDMVKQLITLARQLGLDEAAVTEVESLHGNGAFEDVLDFCREHIGANEYQVYLNSTFGGMREPTALHHHVVALGTPIFTTNYDRMFEAAFQRTGATPPVLTGRDIADVWRKFARGETFLLKLHGSIESIGTVVLSRRDYTRHIFGNQAFMQFVRTVFMTRSVLFIGTALGDHYLRRYLEESAFVTGGMAMPHYAFMVRPGRIYTTQMRERFNIRVIGCDTREELASMVASLRPASAGAPVAAEPAAIPPSPPG
jgi:hypothetical protein